MSRPTRSPRKRPSGRRSTFAVTTSSTTSPTTSNAPSRDCTSPPSSRSGKAALRCSRRSRSRSWASSPARGCWTARSRAGLSPRSCGTTSRSTKARSRASSASRTMSMRCSPDWSAASGSTATRNSSKATSSSPTRSNRRNPTRSLKVGFQLPEVEREVRWPEIVAMTRLGEQVGFDSVWVGDHLLYRDEVNGARGPWEAWTMLAAIAAATSRIAIGPLVACTSFHNPAMLAKMAGTVDEISAGRLILGLGAGWNETEYRAYGFPFDRRVARFAEAFTIIRTLLREGKIDFAGEFYTARDCELVPRPRPGGPPLMVGSIGERMLALTVPYVDSWNAWYAWTGNQPDGVKPLRAKVDAACAAAGRKPADVERTVAIMVRLPGATGRRDTDPSDQVTPLTGSADDMAEALRAYAREGIGHVQLVIDPITEAGLEALAPVLQRLDAGI